MNSSFNNYVIINLFLLVVVVAILYILFAIFIQIKKCNCKVKTHKYKQLQRPWKSCSVFAESEGLS